MEIYVGLFNDCKVGHMTALVLQLPA